MKAIQCEKYGGPEVLKAVELEIPKPKPNEILIKTYTSTVSAADYRVRSFSVPTEMRFPARLMLGFKGPKRSVLGAELAGTIQAIGSEVDRYKVGDEILAAALPYFGGYAEYTCLPESGAIALKPKGLTWKEAAAIPIGAITAYQYLQKAKVSPGKKVLIYGASGSVGTYAIQIA
ncbi:MAG: NAD(P)-dependent alcohol dehydrogenase, partial [Bacteroidota bacterium]